MSSLHRTTVGRFALALVLASCALTAGPARKRKVARAAKVVAAPKAPAPAASAIVNPAALAPFMAALKALEQPGAERVVRVLQFGDSHTAADLWSGRIRRRLQSRFGDAGPGYLLPGKPWRGYPHEGVRLLTGPGWTAQSLRKAECDGLVGLTGAALGAQDEPAPGPAVTLRASFASFRADLLGPSGTTLLASTVPGPPEASAAILAPAPGEAPVAVAPAAEPAQPMPVPLAAEQPLLPGRSLLSFTGVGLPGGRPQELNLFLPPATRLLGVDLRSGRPGVLYDELGLNGAELLDLERWQPDLRRTLLAQAHPDLIVLAYGTNDEGMSPQLQPAFATRARTLLRTLKEAADAPILIIGPLDRVGRGKRQRGALQAGAAWIIQALKDASLECGCAFWDAREAMGGYGSILKWRRSGLAQKDLVHLTGAGYQRLGDQFADTLLAALDHPGGQPRPAAPRPQPKARHRKR